MKKIWMEPKAQLAQFSANEYVNAVCFTQVSGNGYLFFNNDGDNKLDYDGASTGNDFWDFIFGIFNQDYWSSANNNKLAYEANKNDRNQADYFESIRDYEATQGYDQLFSTFDDPSNKYSFTGGNVQLDNSNNQYIFGEGWFTTGSSGDYDSVTIWGTYANGQWSIGAGDRNRNARS